MLISITFMVGTIHPLIPTWNKFPLIFWAMVSMCRLTESSMIGVKSFKSLVNSSKLRSWKWNKNFSFFYLKVESQNIKWEKSYKNNRNKKHRWIFLFERCLKLRQSLRFLRGRHLKQSKSLPHLKTILNALKIYFLLIFQQF